MKYINLFDTQAEYDEAQKYYPNTSYIEATDEVVYQENDPDYYLKQYLTFEALESGTFTFTIGSNVNQSALNITSISYSVDNGDNWTTYSTTGLPLVITTPTVAQGSKVLWKGSAKQMAKANSIQATDISVFSSTGNFNVSGNIMSLLYGDNFASQTTFPSGSTLNFNCLFKSATKLVSVENLVLPATTLANYCYQSMFYGCTSLTTAPELPATTLTESCYAGLFEGCTALTTPPNLPATTLATWCYKDLFEGCTALTTAPTLPATTLATSCYLRTFQNCSNLNNITMLATDISASNCLNNWVQNVAATGTFTKAASMTTLPTGISGIPSGWTVVDA